MKGRVSDRYAEVTQFLLFREFNPIQGKELVNKEET